MSEFNRLCNELRASKELAQDERSAEPVILGRHLIQAYQTLHAFEGYLYLPSESVQLKYVRRRNNRP